MLDTYKTLITRQYEAALSMLKACVDRCPEAVWNSKGANYKFCQLVFHTLIFTDLYLGNEDEQTFRRQPYHLQHQDVFADYEEFEDQLPVRLYEKPAILAYLEHCRTKAVEIMAGESEESLTGRAVPRPSLSRAELHVYNIRHIQHHTGQLSLRLRVDASEDMHWVSSGWREAAYRVTPPG